VLILEPLLSYVLLEKKSVTFIALWDIIVLAIRARRINMINKIAPDKWRHLIAGIIIGIVLQLFLLWLVPGHLVFISAISLTIIAAVSYGFEVFSKVTGKGYYDFIDAVASFIGGVIGMGIATIIVTSIL
jgi:hypothetical protein